MPYFCRAKRLEKEKKEEEKRKEREHKEAQKKAKEEERQKVLEEKAKQEDEKVCHLFQCLWLQWHYKIYNYTRLNQLFLS